MIRSLPRAWRCLVAASVGLSAVLMATAQQVYYYTPLAGARVTGSLNYPQGLAFDAAGKLFVADGNNSVVRAISAGGEMSLFAGTLGRQQHLDGPAAAAMFYIPTALAVDAQGHLFVGDPTGHAVRKISPQGAVTTVARDIYPSGLTLAPDGTIYVAEGGFGTVRKISAGGAVSDFVGSLWSPGNRDGRGTEARIAWAGDIVRAADGTLYVADSNNSSIRKITPDGTVTTLPIRIVDIASGLVDKLSGISGLAIDSAGNLYAAVGGISSVWKITPRAEATLVAGAVNVITETPAGFAIKEFERGHADGIGRAAQFQTPSKIVFGPGGHLYVSDLSSASIRQIAPDGKVTTLVAPPRITIDGEGTRARFVDPQGIALDRATGTLYVADGEANTIRKITRAGVVTTIAGLAGQAGFRDGTGTAARFSRPMGVTLRADGTLFVADTGNAAIRAISPSGQVTTFAGGTGGAADGAGRLAQFRSPSGLAFDRAGNLYVLDSINSTVRKISPAGDVTTLAGAPQQIGFVDGAGAAARFYYPWLGIAVDGAGNVFLADSSNNAVRKISPSGLVSTLAGGNSGQTDGPGRAAAFVAPFGLTFDNDGNLLVTSDRFVRKISPAGEVTTLPGGAVPLEDPSISQSGSAGFLRGIAFDADGVLYAVDPWNARIVRGDLATRARLSNLSVRTDAGTGADALIAGFTTAGTGTSRFVVRGVGPTLATFGVPDVADDPRLTLFTVSGAVHATNDDWDNSDALAGAFASVGAFSFTRGSRDAALQAELPSGSFTAHVSSARSGAALFELYEAGPSATASLSNLSARHRAGGGAGPLTAGFTISGGIPKTVLIRGIGPTLSAFGLTGVLANPELAVFRTDGTRIATNAGWGGAGETERAISRLGAFPLPFISRDAALLLTLAPGNYSVQLSSSDGASGAALIEIYDADP